MISLAVRKQPVPHRLAQPRVRFLIVPSRRGTRTSARRGAASGRIERRCSLRSRSKLGGRDCISRVSSQLGRRDCISSAARVGAVTPRRVTGDNCTHVRRACHAPPAFGRPPLSVKRPPALVRARSDETLDAARTLAAVQVDRGGETRGGGGGAGVGGRVGRHLDGALPERGVRHPEGAGAVPRFSPCSVETLEPL